MKIHGNRFNIYLLAMLIAAGAGGCQSSGERNSKKLVSTLRLHLEVNRDGTKANETVPVYRETPIMVNVEMQPFLSEADVAHAEVIDVVGGFALRLQFNQTGTSTFEQYTVENHGKRIAIFTQFGEKIEEQRWLAAPLITRRVSDGVLTFTPDATREESEEIAVGLNNVAKKLTTWVDR